MYFLISENNFSMMVRGVMKIPLSFFSCLESLFVPRWIKPLPNYLANLGARHRLVAVIEDNSRSGGTASSISQFLRDRNIYTPQRDFGIPEKFLDHASRAQVLNEIGLTAQDISRDIIEAMARLDEAISEKIKKN